jgi:hypothetical protein
MAESERARFIADMVDSETKKGEEGRGESETHSDLVAEKKKMRRNAGRLTPKAVIKRRREGKAHSTQDEGESV